MTMIREIVKEVLILIRNSYGKPGAINPSKGTKILYTNHINYNHDIICILIKALFSEQSPVEGTEQHAT